MKTVLQFSIVLLLLSFPGTRSYAQTDAVPPEVLESWSFLIGDWEIDGEVGEVAVKGTARFDWAEGKHCYFGRQVWQVGQNGGIVQLTQIGGWDAAEHATVEQGFSSAGSAATVHYSPATAAGQGISGTINGVDSPGARWSGQVAVKRTGRDVFLLTTTVDGELVHSLTYVRKQMTGSPQPSGETAPDEE